MPTDQQAENPVGEQRDKKARQTPAKPLLPRRALWTNLANRAREAFKDEDFSPVDSRTGERLMTRREMIATTTLATTSAYVVSRHIGKVLDALETFIDERRPRDIDPTPEELAAVEAILEQSKNSNQYLGSPGRMEAARKHNLTLYNESNAGEAYNRLLNNYRNFRSGRSPDMGDESKLFTFSEYFETAKDILKEKYNIDLVLGDDSHEYSYGGRSLKPEELETVQSKMSILNLLNSVFDQPLELMKLTGLKKISLIKMTEALGYADVGGANDTYFADPTIEAEPGLFDHELYHLYDYKKCGPAQFAQDTGFNAQNPHGFYYTNRGERPLPTNYISDAHYSNLAHNYLADIRSDDPARMPDPEEINSESIQAKFDEWAERVVGIDDYNFAHIVEDKANIGKALLDPYMYRLCLDRRKPHLRRKFIYLLARFYRDNSDIVRYFADVAGKQEPIGVAIYTDERMTTIPDNGVSI